MTQLSRTSSFAFQRVLASSLLHPLAATALLLITLSPHAAITTGTLEPGQADLIAPAASVSTSTSATATSSTAPRLPARWTNPAVEARGVWFDSNEILLPRETIEKKLDALAAANFNIIMIDSWFREYVPYPDSQIVPIYPRVTDKERISWVIAQVRKRGMRADLWPSYGFYAYHTLNAKTDKSMGPLLDKYPYLAAMDSTGQKHLHNPTLGDYYSLCPANPESHRLLGSIIAESVQMFQPDGVNLDRIRFPSQDYCYCNYCRTTFARDTGAELLPSDSGTSATREFLDWKREQNARSVDVIVRMLRKVKPDLTVTAYVVGPEEMDSKAQSWDLWISRNSIDAVAVSLYSANITRPLARAIDLVGGKTGKLFCAISSQHAAPHYLANIHTARQAGTAGQFTWYSGTIMDDIEPLKSGPYAKPARIANKP